MRISIIGSGFIANVHAETIKALGHEITVVISANRDNAKRFAKKWGIPKFGTDFQLALAYSDCVHLCTPPMMHFKHAKAAILAKKHLLCEKPLVINPKEGKELMELAKIHQVHVGVNFNVRYHEVTHRAKRKIGHKDFGSIRMIHGSYLQEFHALSDYYNWRYQEKSGGKMRAVTEIGAHWIDLVRHWTDLEVHSVCANFASFDPQRFVTEDGEIHIAKQEKSKIVTVNSEDVATVFFKFSNGAIGNLVLSEIAHGKKNELKVVITGHKQSLSWNNEQPYQLHVGEKNKPLQTDCNPFGGGFQSTFMGLFKDFYQVIEESKSIAEVPYPTLEDGYINALICEAIYQSAQENSSWVSLNN